MSKVRGETDDRLHSDDVLCSSCSGDSILCEILDNCRQWSQCELHLDDYFEMMTSDWWQLAAVAGKGKIDKVRVRKRNIQLGRWEDVEALKRITQEWEEYD